MKKSNRLTIGILAHVDAGKTTLSEGILYEMGITRSLGRVDHGDAFLDTHQLEKHRGITIFSKQAVFPLEDCQVTLLDTPGHMDFSAEMERVLQVLDYGILLISGPDGIKGQVPTLWALLERYEIPTFIFINKMDQPGTDLARVMEELQQQLDSRCILFSDCSGQTDLSDRDEKLALCDESALDEFLAEGRISDGTIANLLQQRKLFPCYSGSGLKMEGITEFLRGLGTYMIPKAYPEDFGAQVFKVTRDGNGNRLVHMKITGGVLQARQSIGEEKVNQIRIYNGAKFNAVDAVPAGTICAVTGLDSVTNGQGLGFAQGGPKPVLDSVLSYRVLLPAGCDAHDAYRQFSLLEEEIPELHVVWDEESHELRVRLMGEIQAEILQTLVKERFDLDIDFGDESIAYRETITDMVEGVGHFEPLRHYAEVHLLLEPLPVGSGLIFDSVCSEDVLDKNWQRLVLTHLAEREHPGVLTGSPITDMKITLGTGRAHVKHTEGGDFRQATYRAVRQGLRRANCRLLEPYYTFRLEIPADFVGRAMNDIQQMAGSCNPSEVWGQNAVLTGEAPVSTMNGYQQEVLSYTKGAGRLFTSFKGYLPCHNAEEVIAAAGYDPDGDVDNPCGSVFCSHGAGVIIPWDQVEQHMQVPSCLKIRKPAEPSAGESTGAQRRQYSDAELEAIFRQTYGISKRERNPFNRGSRIIRSGDAMGTDRQPKVAHGYNNSQAESILIVDGYNIIFAWEELKEMSRLSLESARSLLIETLQNYQGYTGENIMVVFDAYRQPGNMGSEEQYGALKVVYTREGQTADQYIEKFVLEKAKKLRITVATSDGLEQILIFGQGALRMPARELRERVLSVNAEIRKAIDDM